MHADTKYLKRHYRDYFSLVGSGAILSFRAWLRVADANLQPSMAIPYMERKRGVSKKRSRYGKGHVKFRLNASLSHGRWAGAFGPSR